MVYHEIQDGHTYLLMKEFQDDDSHDISLDGIISHESSISIML